MKYTDFDYELLDCGEERKIERFGKYILDRPCPQATWPRRRNNLHADLVFEKNGKNTQWIGAEKIPEKKWTVNIGDKKALLQLSENGQVGIFPEQFENWKWISEKIPEKSNRSYKILNTFSYTGMSTLFSSTENTEVCHLDGAKSAITWARKNAEISGISENTIRWICDDVMQFMAREIRRGNTYDGIILDPPAFGRGAKKNWKIERDISDLMDLVSKLLSDKPLFVILTCHAPEYFSPRDIADMLESLPQFSGKKAEEIMLCIPSEEGNSLSSSFGARISS